MRCVPSTEVLGYFLSSPSVARIYDPVGTLKRRHAAAVQRASPQVVRARGGRSNDRMGVAKLVVGIRYVFVDCPGFHCPQARGSEEITAFTSLLQTLLSPRAWGVKNTDKHGRARTDAEKNTDKHGSMQRRTRTGTDRERGGHGRARTGKEGNRDWHGQEERRRKMQNEKWKLQIAEGGKGI